jgi:hypothetical protein
MIVLKSKEATCPSCDLWIDPGLEMISKLSRYRGVVPLLEEYPYGSGNLIMESNIGADMVVVLPRDRTEQNEAMDFCMQHGKVLFDEVSGLNNDTSFAIIGPTPFLVLPAERFQMVRSALALLYEMAGRSSRYAIAPGDAINVKMARAVEVDGPLLLVKVEHDVAWPLNGGPDQMLKKMDGFIICATNDDLPEGSIVSLRRFRI